MKLQITKDAFEEITIKDINSFEKRINHTLPTEYKEFLLEHNSSICKNDLIYFKEYNECHKASSDNEHQKNFPKCYKIHKVDGNPEFYERKAIFWQVVSLEKLRITEDENNSDRKYLCFLSQIGNTGAFLSLNEDSFGQIYWCDNEHEGKFIHIANSFDKFINSFEKNSEYSY